MDEYETLLLFVTVLWWSTDNDEGSLTTGEDERFPTGEGKGGGGVVLPPWWRKGEWITVDEGENTVDGDDNLGSYRM
jgi:hypothetical protein